MIIPVEADATNGWWCERCQCYHKYDVYTKPTKSGKLWCGSEGFMKKLNGSTIENAILEFEKKRGLNVYYAIDGVQVDFKHFDLAKFIIEYITKWCGRLWKKKSVQFVKFYIIIYNI